MNPVTASPARSALTSDASALTANDVLLLNEIVYWRLPPDAEGFTTRKLVRELAERIRVHLTQSGADTK